MEVFEAHRRRVELLALSAIPSDTDLFDQSVGAPESRDPAADPGVGIFPHPGACLQLTGMLLVEKHEDWLTDDKAYLTFDDAPADESVAKEYRWLRLNEERRS